MSEARTIAAMLQASIDGPAWHGSAAMELLDGITADQARKRPADDVHSIWELVHHMIAWQEYVMRLLDGGSSDPLEGDVDWPPVPKAPTEEAWEATRRRLEGTQRDLRERMQHLDADQLHAMVPGRDFPLKVVLHGLVHHNVYHIGQVAVVHKLLVGLGAASRHGL